MLHKFIDSNSFVETTTLTGIISAGAVQGGHGLIVEIYDDQGNLLANNNVNNDGSFTLILTPAYSGPVLVRVVDQTDSTNDYLDEATNRPVDLTVDLRASSTINGAGAFTINVSPMTESSVRNLLGDNGGDKGSSEVNLSTVNANEIIESNERIAKALGLEGIDIITTITVVSTDDSYGSGDNNDGEAIGQVLAAISQAEENMGVDTDSVLNMIAQNIDENATLSETVIETLFMTAVSIDSIDLDSGDADFITNDLDGIMIRGSMTGSNNGNVIEVSNDGGISWNTATIMNENWYFEDLTVRNSGDTVTYQVRVLDSLGKEINLTDTQMVTFDSSSPTLTISSDLDTLKIGDSATIQFLFNETPVDFELADIDVSSGDLDLLVVDSLDDTLYTARYTPTNNTMEMVTISVATMRYRDNVGNDNTASSSVGFASRYACTYDFKRQCGRWHSQNW